MTTYVIGDVQGCFAQLQALLVKINIDAKDDILWFTGDLVNRGPMSLEVLRFVKALGDKHIAVLGNHDLHLLAVYYGVKEAHPGDTLSGILNAPDCDELMNWLRHLPLLHHDLNTGFVMTHAGLAPAWDLETAKTLAHEVETVLHGDSPALFLQQMYGNEPNLWSDQLMGMERLRCIVNYLTRMRFCEADGRLNLMYKGTIADKPADLVPWFEVKNRANQHEKIIFGHWAALNGEASVPNVYPLDTGCVWGRSLTAQRLSDGARISIGCG